MAQVNPVLGYQCTLTISGTTGRFKSVSGNPGQFSKVDCTTIADNGNKVATKGLKEVSISGTLEVSDDTAAASILAIAGARTAVQVAFAAGSVSVSGLMHVNISGNIEGGIDDTVGIPIECWLAPQTSSSSTTEET